MNEMQMILGLVVGVFLLIFLVLKTKIHTFIVPPTPGPLGVAGIFGADIGQVILWGIVFSIPLMIVGVIYAKYIGKRLYQLPTEDDMGWSFRRSAGGIE